ncbi:GlsB/YeaQ/YmgE family stress response membrane protein [Emcibacter sp. SYSU 3D8]|uniref:GlsB/YeaQ/YmgE family stress response membrane protein n=1 Tax=Emcibacter sp. SYSU 3D8 TaxID=3133969 RepID=UPI0031FEBB34
MAILWTIIIGFIVGVIAKFITPGNNEPKGFILTTILGIAGAFLATFAGRYMGWYAPGETAGFLGALVGAVILCAIWAAAARKNA